LTGESAQTNAGVGSPMPGTHGLQQMICPEANDVDVYDEETCIFTV